MRLGDLGEVYKLRVGREDADNWAEGGWHLQQVKLQDKHSGKLHVFDFDRWLDRGRDDHDVVRELPVRADGDQGLPSECRPPHGTSCRMGTTKQIVHSVFLHRLHTT